jgi:hypothetical protein
MIKMIDRFTGVEMWVADNRVEEYMAAGHKLAASDVVKPTEAEPVKKKATRKK